MAHLVRWTVALLLIAGAIALLGLAEGEARGEPLRIAFAGPTSGSSAEDGLSAVRAVELIFEDANRNGGIRGRPLELDVYDDRNEPERARANAPLIADEPQTFAVIGHNYSTCSIAAGEIYAERGIPAISTAATNVAVTHGNDWYFRTIYNDRDQGRLIVLYVREVLGAEQLGIVHETEQYGAFLATIMERWAPRVGLDRVDSWGVDPRAADLGTQLDAIADEVSEAEPEFLVLAMQPQAGVQLVKRLRDRDFAGGLVVTDALASQAFLDGFQVFPAERSRRGFYTDGIYASTPFLFDAGGRQASAFMRHYITRYDRAPDWYAAFAADAAKVLVETLQRTELSLDPEDIASDRALLRNALASIDPLEPVLGVTGPNWFNAVGDAEKPVPIGRFLRGEIVSAFAQLRIPPGVRNRKDLDPSHDPGRLVTLGDQILYRSDVAHAGVLAQRFTEIDFKRGTFELEFDLWFRHEGDASVEQIQFTNALEPVALGAPVQDTFQDGVSYRSYRVRGRFRADTIEAPYGEHVLALSFHHRDRTRDDLEFAIDSLGMNLGRERSRAQRTARARHLLGPRSEWTVEDLLFFEDEVDEHALGHPSYLNSRRAARRFSQLTVGVHVRSQALSLRGIVPESYQTAVLALGLIGSAVLVLTGRTQVPRLRWGGQVILALLLLIAAEPLAGQWLRSFAGPYYVPRLSRAFDVLWWAVPAVLITTAINLFVWRPAEDATGYPVPTILRYFIAFLVYLLAFFGVVAFVYDYKLTGLLATSGVLAMIVGLAVQLNITNIFAGVALNMERPFRVGDWIMIHGRTPDPDSSVIGKVTDINWRTTRLETADDTEIVIPNGVISEKTITNFMHPHEISRFALTFNVDQSVSPDKVLPVILKALDSVTGAENEGPVADPPPKVRIRQATENGVEYVVHFHLIPREVSPHKGRHTVNQAVLGALREAGIELAYPRRRIREDRPAEGGAA